MLFMYKRYRSFKLYVDYRALNHPMIPNKYLLLLISKLLDKPRGGKLFTRLDPQNWYNLIKITADDKCKTACCTMQGLFEYAVIQFGLTNAPA